MIIPTLGNGMLYQVWRNKQRWLTNLERRKAIRYMIAIAVCIAIIIFAWSIAP